MSTGGKKRFEDFYSQIYNPKRWKTLYAALNTPATQLARISCFVDKNEALASLGPTAVVYNNELFTEHLAGVFSNCTVSTDGSALPQPASINNVKAWYFLDAASIIPVVYLTVQPGHRVLDLCAAPGGKSLVIADRLGMCTTCGLHDWQLTSNEPDHARYNRLKRVLHEYIPADRSSHVTAVNSDGSKLHNNTARFDRVLVDAPCSSERHLLEPANAAQLGAWTVSETRNRAAKQLEILMSALRCVAKGGIVVYSTCSICPLENDCVIANAVDRFNSMYGDKEDGQCYHEVEIVNDFERYRYLINKDLDCDGKCAQHISCDADAVAEPGQWVIKGFVGEQTKHGHIILPDKFCGHGPIYYAIITKHLRTPEVQVDDDDEEN